MFNNNNNIYKSALEKYAGKHLLSLIDKNKEEQLKLHGEIKDLTVSIKILQQTKPSMITL
ncbi:MAG TPA: hypothetical protein PK514_11225 [Spirochaetota bacterium]|nr:hypothetical protein [Spirochaetota bacterium]